MAHLVVVIGLLNLTWAVHVGAQTLSTDERKPAAQKTPPWSRELSEEDAQRVAALQAEIDPLRADGKYTEAIAVADKILDIRRRALGHDHWQTIYAVHSSETLRKIADLPRAAQVQLENATNLSKDITRLQRSGKIQDALRRTQQVLEVCQQHLGEENLDTLICGRGLAGLQHSLGHSEQGEQTLKKTLALLHRTAGQDHPEVLRCQNSLAMILNARGKYAEAEVLENQVWQTRRRLLGDEHPKTLESRLHLADNLKHQYKFKRAEKLLRDTLAMCRQEFGQDDYLTVITMNNLAMLLNDLGRPAEAEPLLANVLTAYRKELGDQHPETLRIYNNLGVNWSSQYKDVKAGALHAKTLELRRKTLGGKHPSTILSYNNLAASLRSQGRTAEAEAYLREVYEICIRHFGEEHQLTLMTATNLANCLDEKGDVDSAEALTRKTLELQKKVLPENDHLTLANSTNLALLLARREKFAEADNLLSPTLLIRRQIWGDLHPATMRTQFLLARNQFYQGHHESAQKMFHDLLEKRTKVSGRLHPDTINCRHGLALCLYAQGDFDEAMTTWTEAANSFEAARLRSDNTGLKGVGFRHHFSPLRFVAAILGRRGKGAEAWQRLEQNMARGLSDEISARWSRPLTAEELDHQERLRGRLHSLNEQLAAMQSKTGHRDAAQKRVDELRLQRAQLEDELAELHRALVEKYGAAAREPYDLTRIQSQLSENMALLTWLDIDGRATWTNPNGEHWACVIRSRGEPVWVELSGSGSNGRWTDEDRRLPSDVRTVFSVRPLDDGDTWQKLGRRIYDQRLAPVEPYLAAMRGLPPVKQLIVLPTGRLAGVPIEALSAISGTGSTPNYIVSYAPSATVFAWLREQGSAETTAPSAWFAVADPVIDADDDGPSQKIGGPPVEIASSQLLPRLVGSRMTVDAVAPLFEKNEILLGEEANEESVQKKAADGSLRQYDYLHFAVHGEANDRVPLQSALILSQDRRSNVVDLLLSGQPVYDGRVTAKQIARTWKLGPSLVVLGACETYLGTYREGEGYLGFSQALFVAGARSLVLSLWKVDDLASSLLMIRFYQNLLGRRSGLNHPLPKAEALHEAKHWLRQLRIEEAQRLVQELPVVRRGKIRDLGGVKPISTRPFEHPYYWAGFVLIGHP